MRMAVVFGMNQVVSHGFGMFLFAALVPLMRESTGLSYWHLALAGALTQLAYLGGALILGLIGPKLGTRKIALVSGAISTSLLFSMPMLQQPLNIILALVVLAASAAMSWGAIVEIISRCAPQDRRSTYLSSASSGTAWGYGITGLVILWIVPFWGWESSWRLAGIMGALVLGVTWYMLRTLPEPELHAAGSGPAAIPVSQLLKTLFTERTAFFACLICFLVGFCTMPFSTWLNTYLEELKLPAELGGYSWSTVGITGMVAGFVTGKLADRKGHATALLLIFAVFALGQLAFSYSPAEMVLLASFGYGLMYFPMWGIVAGWVNQQYSATATMQISGICMVTFGLGGALGNLLLGFIRDVSGFLQPGFMLLSMMSLVLLGLGLHIRRRAGAVKVNDIAPSV
ncbi:MAG: MFS transporter [Oceanospirillaceae bacterium]|uniref:MFS transporter n=1 Tax=Marinobacterium litorale TaxID=404770 RepID=UPI0003F4FD03|nr:MFS transporter [Marinobacterium litorale]MBS97584.1 MFS transporter [Oceanospirillaceae bacterium]